MEVVDISKAKATVETIEAFVGWEMWEIDHSLIPLDGMFTLDELEALVVVLRHHVSHR